MNEILNQNLIHNAFVLREMVAKKASAKAIATAKSSMLSRIYTFLTTCYGVPPTTFAFEGRGGKDGSKYFREEGYTPITFRDKYIGNLLNDYVSIINSPTEDKPFHKLYTVDFLGNVADAAPIQYLNLPMDEFKDLILTQLRSGEIVWFGSDSRKYGDRTEKRLWDDAMYDYELTSGLDLSLTKAQQLDGHYSVMCHAMVLTGVNLVDNKPTRWKIENSWGKEDPNKGYYYASDSWFDKFVYQAVIHKKHLAAYAKCFKQKPILLKPWDPMGTLAD